MRREVGVGLREFCASVVELKPLKLVSGGLRSVRAPAGRSYRHRGPSEPCVRVKPGPWCQEEHEDSKNADDGNHCAAIWRRFECDGDSL